jgi:hypothetical protein
MLMPLCSLARNPDGTLVRPTAYEINAAMSQQLALAAGAVLLVAVVFAAAQWRHPSVRRAIVCVIVGALAMAIHPLWTVETNGGDCGAMQVLCSWLVLGLEVALIGLQLMFRVWRSDTGNPERTDYKERVE